MIVSSFPEVSNICQTQMFEIHCRNQLTVNVKTDPGIQRTAALAYRHHHLSLVSGICLKVIIG